MIATAMSATLLGVEGRRVRVEVHVSQGLPSFTVVGLPDAACREARDRARAAVLCSGLTWPQRRVTVNLAPSAWRKDGSVLDLPIALAVLAADGQLDGDLLSGIAFLGELGLDGSLRGVPGVLALVSSLSRLTVVVPSSCAAEAAAVAGPRVRAAPSLRSLLSALRGEAGWPALPSFPRLFSSDRVGPDLADVRGQPVGRLAVEVSAAGGHHLLLCGPPGAGKTMLARRLVGLLPDLPSEAALEVGRVHSAAGLLGPGALLSARPPFRAPHHTASTVALIGGGSARLRPGEASCAHRGVLFLDELAEFSSDALDSLRQPLEEGRILVCRARASVAFPAEFLLVAAMNPCPCGGDGSPGGCRCSDVARQRYTARVSGPLLDRFDLRLGLAKPDPTDLLGGAANGPGGESTALVAERVRAARLISSERGLECNARIPAQRLDELAPLEAGARSVLETRLRQGRLSARGLHRVRRVARTLADLGGRPGPIAREDVLQALALRSSAPFPGERPA